MFSRRTFLHAASLAGVHGLSGSPWAYAQQQQSPAHPDEMTANTARQRQAFIQYDFGPVPATLPAETLALQGDNSLRAHARSRGLVAGAAVVVSREVMADPAMQQLLAQQYGMLVPSNELKWVALRPSRNTFDFSRADALFAFCEAHGMAVRGHTLCWHQSVPKWLEQDAATLNVRDIFVEHIRTVVGRYKGRVHSWDVVNEAISPADGEPNGMRTSFWAKNVGPDYIELAFRTAREADPHAKLAYNDYGVETDAPDQATRRRDILALLRRLQAAKVPIDAVGIQAHIKAASKSAIGSGLRDYMAAIAAMGLDIYVTELDVDEDAIQANDVVTRDRLVAETYRQFLEIALSSSAVKLVLTWGTSDRNTWLNDVATHRQKQPDRMQRALPFDAGYKPTPAFFAMRDVFDRAPLRS